MYMIFLDEAFSYGDYSEVIGCTKTKKEVKKLIERAIKQLKKSPREEPDGGWNKDCFLINKMNRNGIDKDWVELIMEG
jgi:hypothetical protein